MITRAPSFTWKKSDRVTPAALHTYDPNRNGLCYLTSRSLPREKNLFWLLSYTQAFPHFIKRNVL